MIGEAAIYLLRDEETGKVFYLGSTTGPKHRIGQHRTHYGRTTTMLIIKVVDLKDQWAEELELALEYKKFLPEGLMGMNPPTRKEL